ncbi:ABC transporter ATP-binding protein [Leeuwenhoekiella sp. W20_SRS_FM14]|uniref:ABC transporter ATP-binding protein n=1 Tax=Leeuwenhoekiella sp. W20_SRS_FM14 TaxID=3240270 RepID=UPI003F9983B3
MTKTILKAENISKQYRLGTVGTGTLRDDFKRNWARLRGKEDPFLKVGAVNDRSQKSTEDYVWALREINFEVKQGEVLGIIGKNGAGKSTLLKILSRVTAPTTGLIKSRGRIASLLEVGTGFNHELTGRENIYLNGAILGMTKAEISSKLDEIIDFSGCERYIDTPTKRYSSGMTVRLAFAVAAFLEPEILVVDEVLAVGDAEFQKKAIGKMQDISQGEGRTVLFVSHNMSSVRSLCTRGIVLENGYGVFESDATEAVNYYLRANDTSKSETDLYSREDRTGNGKIIVSKIETYSKNGSKIDSVISGDFLKIRFSFEIREKIGAKLILGFALRDQNEELKAMVVTDEMGADIDDFVKRGFIDFDIEKLSLRGGLYNLQFTLSEKTTSKENHIDYLEKAFYLKVLEGDFYKVGKLNRAYTAVILPFSIV